MMLLPAHTQERCLLLAKIGTGKENEFSCDFSQQQVEDNEAKSCLLKINNKNGDKLKSLQDENLNLFPSNDDSNELKDVEEYLQDIGDEQDFTITYVDVEEKSKSDKYHCFVQLATNPVAVCFGIGEKSAKEARVDAARNALEYLRIMTK